jgi:hypothetical protein
MLNLKNINNENMNEKSIISLFNILARLFSIKKNNTHTNGRFQMYQILVTSAFSL